MMVATLTLIAMGKYGWFVWPSYGVALGVLLGLSVSVWRSYKSWQARLTALEADEARDAVA